MIYNIFRYTYLEKIINLGIKMKGNMYSEYALKLVREQHKIFDCPKCGHELLGERYCPSCKSKIIYNGEKDYYLKNSKLYSAGNSMQKAGDTMQKTGNSLSSLGCAMILFITIPVIIILILLFL
jgi:ribosomal protein L32